MGEWHAMAGWGFVFHVVACSFSCEGEVEEQREKGEPGSSSSMEKPCPPCLLLKVGKGRQGLPESFCKGSKGVREVSFLLQCFAVMGEREAGEATKYVSQKCPRA